MQTTSWGRRATSRAISALVSDLNDNAKIEVDACAWNISRDVPDIIEKSYFHRRQVEINARMLNSNCPHHCLKSGRTACGWVRFLPTWSAMLTNIPRGWKILVGAEVTRINGTLKAQSSCTSLVRDNGMASVLKTNKNFQRFFRSDDSKARESPVTGLGLNSQRVWSKCKAAHLV